MTKIQRNRHNYQHKYGFTLIELVVVIILIAIMAVSVLPKIFSSNGFEEYTYRDELITKLRAIQLRSMQQTNNSRCQSILVTPSSIGLQGADSANSCTTGYAGDSTTVTIENNHDVIFTVSGGLSKFSFSSMGRPLCDTTSLTPCKIILNVVGESVLDIEINQEGYIHAI